MLQAIADRRRQCLMLDIAGVPGRGRLEDQHVNFIIGNCPVLDTSRHDDEFTFAELYDPVSKLDPKGATQDKKQLVLVLVMMPHELALELDELHFLPIQLADDLGSPVLSNLGKLLCQIYFLHLGYPTAVFVGV